MSSGGEPRESARPVLLTIDDAPDLTLRSRPGSTEFVVALPLGKAVAAHGEA